MEYQFLSYSKLPILKEEIDKKIDASVSSSIKTVTFNRTTKVISFYNVETVVEGETEPVLEITIPDPDDVIKLLTGATEGTY